MPEDLTDTREPRRIYVDVPVEMSEDMCLGLYDHIAAMAHRYGLTAGLGRVPDQQEDRMSQDTDRIIAAHRDEARRTRTLLVAIFVGLPLVGLALWLIIAVIAAGSSSSPSSAPYNVATEFSAPVTTTVDVPTTTVPAAMADFTVTDKTMCSTIEDWYASDSSGVSTPLDADIYGGSSYVSPGEDPLGEYLTGAGRPYSDLQAVQTYCAGHDGSDGLLVNETVLYALHHLSS